MEFQNQIKAKSTILIVDDSAENIFSLSKILEANKYIVDCACSGEEALKKVLKKEYALILLDVQMPGMNGYEVAEALKGATKTKHIPIIFLTAMSKEKNFAADTESGPVDYVVKPFDIDLLLMKINNFLIIYHVEKELYLLKKELSYMVESD
jgi:CheY-like chemotaxis protein